MNWDWISWVCLMILLLQINYPSKVKALEKRFKAFEKRDKNEKSVVEMSKLISELKGKKCTIQFDASIDNIFDNELECTIVDVDDEWIKITYTVKNKKAEETVSKIVRIDNIDSIELED